MKYSYWSSVLRSKTDATSSLWNLLKPWQEMWTSVRSKASQQFCSVVVGTFTTVSRNAEFAASLYLFYVLALGNNNYLQIAYRIR
jgi:hypothetical protein